MITGTQFKMNLFSEGDIPYRRNADVERGGALSDREGIAAYLDLRMNDSAAPPAAGRLTVTPDTDYTQLSEAQKALWVRVQGGCSAISGQARLLYGSDNVQGIDQNPEKGRIQVQAVQGEEFIEEDMTLKDPDNTAFDLKNIESFNLKAINSFTGDYALMSLQSGVEMDIDGDGKMEKGMLCTFREGAQNGFSGRSGVVGDMQAFINDNTQSITLIENVANPMM
ncbi:MAG: hypothetical protein AB9903_20975 [Vulcanimicrobiota bacterium]